MGFASGASVRVLSGPRLGLDFCGPAFCDLGGVFPVCLGIGVLYVSLVRLMEFPSSGSMPARGPARAPLGGLGWSAIQADFGGFCG